jgi:hypothetical protein
LAAGTSILSVAILNAMFYRCAQEKMKAEGGGMGDMGMGGMGMDGMPDDDAMMGGMGMDGFEDEF